MALTDIHLQSDIGHGMPADDSFAVVDGRALAINGVVTLDTSVVTRPSCAAGSQSLTGAKWGGSNW
jgi:hypothetical protein